MIPPGPVTPGLGTRSQPPLRRVLCVLVLCLVGAWPTWAGPALFVRGLGTTLDRDRAVVGNVGAQVDVRLGVASTQQLTLSFGGAVAMERGRGSRREAMVSLEILR